MAKQLLCVDCMNQGKPKMHTKGSIIIELLLWLFIIPGLIYSIWRQTSKVKVCRSCGGANLIPLDSPRAQQLLTAPAEK